MATKPTPPDNPPGIPDRIHDSQQDFAVKSEGWFSWMAGAFFPYARSVADYLEQWLAGLPIVDAATKADRNGNPTEKFKVADGEDADEAVNVRQMTPIHLEIRSVKTNGDVVSANNGSFKDGWVEEYNAGNFIITKDSNNREVRIKVPQDGVYLISASRAIRGDNHILYNDTALCRLSTEYGNICTGGHMGKSDGDFMSDTISHSFICKAGDKLIYLDSYSSADVILRNPTRVTVTKIGV